MNELVAEYLAHEKTKGRRKQYLVGLRRRVPWLLRFLDEQGLAYGELKVKQAYAFQGSLIESKTKDGRKYANHTVLSYMTAASSFYDFLKERGAVASNPFREIRKVRADKKLPRHILKEKEMNTFLDALAKFDEGPTLKHRVTRYRVHVIAEFLYSTGLRMSEAAQLRPDDIDFRRSLVEVRDGKGGVARVAFLNEYAREVLRLYVEKMRPLVFSEWNERNGDLLFGTGSERLGHTVNSTLAAAAKEADVPAPTSHGFRHALGFHLLRSGCGVRHIQQILGHKKLATTEIYTKVEKEDLKTVMDRHHPRIFRRISLETA